MSLPFVTVIRCAASSTLMAYGSCVTETSDARIQPVLPFGRTGGGGAGGGGGGAGVAPGRRALPAAAAPTAAGGENQGARDGGGEDREAAETGHDLEIYRRCAQRLRLRRRQPLRCRAHGHP